ncbi:MAG TPA: hypothetical protein GX534_04340 [Thermoanaerobacterales bacterium]|nr:hypothetical protein [Thermoanaerobacterales bacterium]
MKCKNLKGCPFFNDTMADMPSTAEMFKKSYCLDDPSECARYIVSNKLGKEYVPDNLFPNQHDRAQKLIQEN